MAAASGLLSFGDVRIVDVQTGCVPNEAYTALMQCNDDMLRACWCAHNRVSSGYMAALVGGVPLVTPHIYLEPVRGWHQVVAAHRHRQRG